MEDMELGKMFHQVLGDENIRRYIWQLHDVSVEFRKEGEVKDKPFGENGHSTTLKKLIDYLTIEYEWSKSRGF